MFGHAHMLAGMVWSAFRASDDQQKYSYHIPDNMYLVGALQRLRVINAATWRSSYISITAARLVEEVSRGIEQHGIVQLQVNVIEHDSFALFIPHITGQCWPSTLQGLVCCLYHSHHHCCSS
jgi:meiotically up-regulated gene 157 (Mug157) protein